MTSKLRRTPRQKEGRRESVRKWCLRREKRNEANEESESGEPAETENVERDARMKSTAIHEKHSKIHSKFQVHSKSHELCCSEGRSDRIEVDRTGTRVNRFCF